MNWWHQNRRLHARVTNEDLSAFADGELPRRRAREVAAGIRRTPDYADRVHAYWLREADLWRAYGEAAAAPAHMPRLSPRPGGFGRGLAAGAGGAFLAASITAVLWWQSPPAPPPAQEGAFNLTQTIMQAFNNPVALAGNGNMPTLPFDQLGLSPSGQQPLPVPGRQILEYRFENTHGQRVALYEVDNGGGDEWLHVLSRAPVTLVRWSQDGRGYVLAGDDAPLEMTRLAMGMHDAIAMGASAADMSGAGAEAGGGPGARGAHPMEGASRNDVSEM